MPQQGFYDIILQQSSYNSAVKWKQPFTPKQAGSLMRKSADWIQNYKLYESRLCISAFTCHHDTQWQLK